MHKRVDNTQKEIVAVLRKLGASVVHLHTVGQGCPDIAFAYRHQTYLAEIKNGPLGYKFTPSQKRFHVTWRAPIALFDSVESVIEFIKEVDS